MFYVAYRTLLVLFCVLKFYFVDLMECLHFFKSAKFGRQKMHVLCKVEKNIIFQNRTLLVMFYRQNKTYWYQFCNFKHFLKADIMMKSLAYSWQWKWMDLPVPLDWEGNVQSEVLLDLVVKCVHCIGHLPVLASCCYIYQDFRIHNHFVLYCIQSILSWYKQGDLK